MPTITDINSSSFWEQKSSLFGLLNYSITTAEKRLAAITGGRDTISANSGYMVFDTLLNGTLVERMRVTSAGKVGIGTTNPAWTLDVTGDINASGALRLNGAALSTAGNFWAAGSGGAIYYNGGNVGIGTGTPSSLLNVSGSNPGAAMSVLTLNNSASPATGDSVRIRLGPSSGFVSAPQLAPYIEGILENTNGELSGLAFGTYNSPLAERMRITAAGNVGIGTASPQAQLHITSSAGNASMYMDATPGGGHQWALLSANSSGGGWATASAFSIVDNTAGTLRLTINASGNVGIGTTSPQVLLDLPYVTSNSAVRFGSMEFATTGLNLSFWSDNLWYNGSAWFYRNTGFGSQIGHWNGFIYFYTAPSGTAAATAAMTEQFKVGPSGLVKIANLPTVAPGAGSKQLWADPADGYRVKWVN